MRDVLHCKLYPFWKEKCCWDRSIAFWVLSPSLLSRELQRILQKKTDDAFLCPFNSGFKIRVTWIGTQSSTLMGLGLQSALLFFFLQNVKAFPGWSFLSKFSLLPHVTGNRSSGNVNAACGPSRTRKILLAANGNNNKKKSASKRTAADDFIPISNLRTY